MPLLTLQDAGLAYGLAPLLDAANLVVDAGERIGLIGRNGTGKSSLLGVLAGDVALDDGTLARRDGLVTVRVEQEPVLPPAPTLDESLVVRGRVDTIADERRRWHVHARIGEWLQRFGLDAGRGPAGLSGGEAKRAALALAIALGPDLLLLDEPTNHLDIDGIRLLEDALTDARDVPTLVVVTHDRAFLDRVVTRIVELDRGLLRSYPGNFAAYEQRKTGELAAEAVAARKFDRFWAQEEAWIRKGVEARRTRNEGRVRRLERLRAERAERRERSGNVKLALDAGTRSGKLVAELEHVGKRYGERVIVDDLSLRILRGDRIGIVGPNGAGKSTLLKLILGELPPDRGRVRLGTNLAVAYFDQLRGALDPERTLADTIAPGSDWIELPDGRKHVLTYLGDFLFPPQRARAPVRMLSGGERNRLLLARLFAQPANLLVLDEPTNDLDIESLELLEATLQTYAGTLLLVSHDRAFLDNVVTSTLVSEGHGRWREFVGGYRDWLLQRGPDSTQDAGGRGGAGKAAGRRTAAPAPATAKLTFAERLELANLPAELEALEEEQRELLARMSGPDYYRQEAARLKADGQRLATLEQTLAEKMERWVALDARA
ncbi:MAG: ATP-binding cassette domain-containing protein [Proteobacteria bacterium]|nr:ATP-binding cassette domain-containing protein [Pseudomonadota bacterium]